MKGEVVGGMEPYCLEGVVLEGLAGGWCPRWAAGARGWREARVGGGEAGNERVSCPCLHVPFFATVK